MISIIKFPRLLTRATFFRCVSRRSSRTPRLVVLRQESVVDEGTQAVAEASRVDVVEAEQVLELCTKSWSS